VQGEALNTRHEVILAIAAAGRPRASTSITVQEAARMEASVTAESVVRFLNHFEEVAMQEDFSLLEDMIDERAYFRFNDGDFVGRKAIQSVFEKTWKGDPTVKKARFYFSNLHVQLGRRQRQPDVQDSGPGHPRARVRRRKVPDHS
jgi:hypothetical protein